MLIKACPNVRPIKPAPEFQDKGPHNGHVKQMCDGFVWQKAWQTPCHSFIQKSDEKVSCLENGKSWSLASKTWFSAEVTLSLSFMPSVLFYKWK